MSLPSDRLLSDEWHIRTREPGGFDLDVLQVWDPVGGPAYTGAGTRTVVIDDGFDYRHPDLAPNYDTSLDRDYRQDDADPFGNASDAHGTAVAGIIGAAADGAGTVGLAYETELVGFRTASIIGDPWLEESARRDPRRRAGRRRRRGEHQPGHRQRSGQQLRREL